MKNELLILGIETALKKASLALLRGKTELASYVEEKQVSRAEDLLETIDSFLRRNDFKIKDIDLIAVSVGPGSFTGIRVGIATVQALSMGASCRSMGISILDALALETDSPANIISVVPSGRDNLIWKTLPKTNHTGKQGNIEQVGAVPMFIDYIKNFSADDIIIIAETNAYDKFRVYFETLEVDKMLIYASDNVAASIALLGYLKQDTLSNNLEPQYILNVDIG